jgi:hypothetical protein
MGLLDRMQKREAMPAQRDPYAGTYGPGKAGGYAGAAINRLTSSLANWSGSGNFDLDGNIAILRARARHLTNNDELGKRFLSLVATNVVGRNNPQLQVRAFDIPQSVPGKTAEPKLDKTANDSIESHWVRWGRTLDITGRRKSFPAFCRLIVKAVARDGEALIRIIRNRDLEYGMALQALEADRLQRRAEQRQYHPPRRGAGFNGPRGGVLDQEHAPWRILWHQHAQARARTGARHHPSFPGRGEGGASARGYLVPRHHHPQCHLPPLSGRRRYRG